MHVPNATPQKPIHAEELTPIAERECFRLFDGLKHHGITDILIGKELEFQPHPDFAPNPQQVESLRHQAIRFLEAQKSDLPPEKQQKIDRKIERIQEFSPGELVMFDMIEMDPQTSPHLEHLFGNHPTHGYYDNPGVFELKYKPHCMVEHFTVDRLIRQKIVEKYEALGLTFYKPPNPHLSFSLWRDGKNLYGTGADNIHFIGQSIEGASRALYDALALTEGFKEFPSYANVDAGPSKMNFLRVTRDRIEMRVINPVNDDAIATAILLAGINYRLNNPEPKSYITP